MGLGDSAVRKISCTVTFCSLFVCIEDLCLRYIEMWGGGCGGGQCDKKNLLYFEDSVVNYFSYRTAPHPLPHLHTPMNSGQCSKLKIIKPIRNQQETVMYIKERSGT